MQNHGFKSCGLRYQIGQGQIRGRKRWKWRIVIRNGDDLIGDLIQTDDIILKVVIVKKVRGILIIRKIQDPTDIKPTPFLPMASGTSIQDVIATEAVIIAIVRVVEVYQRRKTRKSTTGRTRSLRGGRHPLKKIETTLISEDVDEKDPHPLLHQNLIPVKLEKVAREKINDPNGG